MKRQMLKLLSFILITLLITACTSRINKTNYDKIQTGMSYRDVVDILGDPTNSASLSIGKVMGTSAYWEHRNSAISIHFINGRVKVKQFIEGVSTPREGR